MYKVIMLLSMWQCICRRENDSSYTDLLPLDHKDMREYVEHKAEFDHTISNVYHLSEYEYSYGTNALADAAVSEWHDKKQNDDKENDDDYMTQHSVQNQLFELQKNN